MKRLETDRSSASTPTEQVTDRAVTPEEGLRLLSAFRRIDGAGKREEAMRLVETLATESKRR